MTNELHIEVITLIEREGDVSHKAYYRSSCDWMRNAGDIKLGGCDVRNKNMMESDLH